MSRQALEMLRKLDRRITVKWEPLETFVTRHQGEVVKPEIECAGCHKQVPVTEAQTTVVFGVHDDELPVKGYVHCPACALKTDAKTAWVTADAEARQPWWEAAPDQLEKAKQDQSWMNEPWVRGHDE